MRLFITLIVILALTGCKQTREEADRAFLAAAAECQKDSVLTRENVMQRVGCFEVALRQYGHAINYAIPWNFENWIVADRESAKKFAAGQISLIQFRDQVEQHRIAAAKVDEQAEEQLRAFQRQENGL